MVTKGKECPKWWSGWFDFVKRNAPCTPLWCQARPASVRAWETNLIGVSKLEFSISLCLVPKFLNCSIL